MRKTQVRNSLPLEQLACLERENQRIRELLSAGPRESAEQAVERLWRSYRDLLDKISHLHEDCQRDAGKFGLGADTTREGDEEVSPAEAQAEWERSRLSRPAATGRARRKAAKRLIHRLSSIFCERALP